MGWDRAFAATATYAKPEHFETFRRHIDAAWIEEALTITGTATVRRRRLPVEEVIWVVLGMALFRDRPIEDVVSKLDLALPGGGGTVARSSISQARARLGSEPMEWLFGRSASAWAHTSAAAIAGEASGSTASTGALCVYRIRRRIERTSVVSPAAREARAATRWPAWSRSWCCARTSSRASGSGRTAAAMSSTRRRSSGRASRTTRSRSSIVASSRRPCSWASPPAGAVATGVAKAAKVEPTRISFVESLRLICDEWLWLSVTSAGAIPKRLASMRANIKRYILPPRRPKRLYPRAVKIKMSNYDRKRPRVETQTK